MPYAPTQMSGTYLAFFREKLGVSSIQYLKLSAFLNQMIISSSVHASLAVAKSFFTGFKAIKDLFLDTASKEP